MSSMSQLSWSPSCSVHSIMAPFTHTACLQSVKTILLSQSFPKSYLASTTLSICFSLTDPYDNIRPCRSPRVAHFLSAQQGKLHHPTFLSPAGYALRQEAFCNFRPTQTRLLSLNLILTSMSHSGNCPCPWPSPAQNSALGLVPC